MKYDIAIIGAGPGGYVAAIRAAQLGAKVALIEKDKPGGVCLHWGCIPSKSIIASVDRYNAAKRFSKFGIHLDNLSYNYSEIFQRKEKIVQKLCKGLIQLIKGNGIDLITGVACLESDNSLKVHTGSGEELIEFDNLIIASGSRTCSLPNIELDHEFVIDTNDVLKLQELPESVLIVGSGAVGIEWVRIFDGFDKEVKVIEVAPKLSPMLDNSLSEAIERSLKRKKIDFYTNTCIKEVREKKVVLSNGMELAPDIVFLAAGRVPNVEIKGIESLNLEFNGRFFKVDRNLRTSADNIYAIGDVNGIFPLAHVASHEGIRAVEHIMLNKEAPMNYQNIPFVIYGHPEAASIGYTEDQLKEKGMSYKKSLFPMSILGKAMAEDETDGFVKVLANEEEILGIHIISDNGSELVQQLTIAKSTGLKPENLKEVVFPHPTYSEAIHESILGLYEESLHLPPGIKLRM